MVQKLDSPLYDTVPECYLLGPCFEHKRPYFIMPNSVIRTDVICYETRNK